MWLLSGLEGTGDLLFFPQEGRGSDGGRLSNATCSGRPMSVQNLIVQVLAHSRCLVSPIKSRRIPKNKRAVQYNG